MTRGEARLAEKFASARSRGRAAFVAYLTAGDPSFDRTLDLARRLDRAGADILELGVPFSDPIADGPTLQRAARRALDGGATLPGVFAAAREIRRATDLALVLFSYANPLLAFGFRRAMRSARESGFDGVLLTDVPPEEAGEFLPEAAACSLAPVFLVSPSSPPERMREAGRLSRGFLYVVSRNGVTGERKALPAALEKTIRRARAAALGLPVAVGFGIADAATAHRVALRADGVVVGSALVAAGARGEGTAGFERLAAELAKACRR